MFGNKFTPENLQNSVLNAIHPSVRAKVVSSSGLQFSAAFHVFFTHLTFTSFRFLSPLPCVRRRGRDRHKTSCISD